MRSRNRGLTLIELMVVIVILGIIGTIAYVSVSGAPIDALHAKAKTDMGEITKALQHYAIAHGGDYPQSLDEVAEKFNGGAPKDPFSKAPYDYQPRPDGFMLTCLGKDQSPGGEKPYDKDIVYTEKGFMPEDAAK